LSTFFLTFNISARNEQRIFTANDIKLGFLKRSEADLQNMATNLAIQLPSISTSYSMPWPGFSRGGLQGLTFEQYATLQIWKKILE
jgi:hypothetical protein